jgi:hypothetical protein
VVVPLGYFLLIVGFKWREVWMERGGWLLEEVEVRLRSIGILLDLPPKFVVIGGLIPILVLRLLLC